MQQLRTRKVRGDRQACQTCRSQKRRCDKALPACSLCRRAGRDCDYDISNTSRLPPTAALDAAQPAFLIPSPSSSGGHRGSTGLDSPSHTTRPTAPRIGFPSSFFLDYSVFKLQRPTIPDQSDIALSPELMRYIKRPAEIRHDVDIYFQSTHTFFPIGEAPARACLNPVLKPNEMCRLQFQSCVCIRSFPRRRAPPVPTRYCS